MKPAADPCAVCKDAAKQIRNKCRDCYNGGARLEKKSPKARTTRRARECTDDYRARNRDRMAQVRQVRPDPPPVRRWLVVDETAPDSRIGPYPSRRAAANMLKQAFADLRPKGGFKRVQRGVYRYTPPGAGGSYIIGRLP